MVFFLNVDRCWCWVGYFVVWIVRNFGYLVDCDILYWFVSWDMVLIFMRFWYKFVIVGNWIVFFLVVEWLVFVFWVVICRWRCYLVCLFWCKDWNVCLMEIGCWGLCWLISWRVDRRLLCCVGKSNC